MLITGMGLLAIGYYTNQSAEMSGITFGEALIEELTFAPMMAIGFMFLISLTMFIQPPIKVEKKSPLQRRKERKKKLPNRRKDYR